MSSSVTVGVLGDGSVSNPRRPDIGKDYKDATYHNDGTVTITVIE